MIKGNFFNVFIQLTNEYLVKMQRLSLSPVLRPLTITCNLLMITQFRVKNGRLYKSKLRVFFSFIIWSLCTGISLHSVWSLMDRPLHSGKLTILIMVIRPVGSLLVMTLIFIYNFKNFMKLNHLIDAIEKIDVELGNFGKNPEILSLAKKHRKFLIFLLIFVNFILNFVTNTPFIRDFYVFAMILSYVYPRFVANISNIIFYIFTIILESRFRIINDLLREYTSVVYKPQHFESLKKIFVQYKDLVHVGMKLNEMFSLHLFLWLGLSFILSIGDLHATMFWLVSGRSHFRKMTVIVLTSFIGFIFDLWYVAKRCTNLAKEVNLTKVLLVGIKLDVLDEISRNKVL